MKDVLRLALPLTLWLASFSAIYGLHGLVCAGYWPGAGRMVLVAAAALAVGLQIAVLMALRAHPPRAPMLRFASLALAVVAVIAIIWTVLPITFLALCV